MTYVFGVPFEVEQARRFLRHLSSVGKRIDFLPMQRLLEESHCRTADGWGITQYTDEWAEATKNRGGGSGSAFKEELGRQLEGVNTRGQ